MRKSGTGRSRGGDRHGDSDCTAGGLPASLTVVLARGTAPFSGALLLRYTIDAPGFAGTAGLRLPYEEGDLNGNDPTKLHLWHLAGDTWTLQPATARGVDALGKHYVESSGVTGFSDWALSAGGAPAAVTVLDWAAGWVDGHVRLRWQTASELDCLGFLITRSRTPGDRGEQVAEVAAQVPGSPAGAVYTWEDHRGGTGGRTGAGGVLLLARRRGPAGRNRAPAPAGGGWAAGGVSAGGGEIGEQGCHLSFGTLPHRT